MPNGQRSYDCLKTPSIILYLSSLLMKFIEIFNACLGHYFDADKHFMVMMMIVTVRLILLGTIVTWQSCRPLVLFLNKITMDILTGHGHSHGHKKYVIDFTLWLL